LEITGFAQPGWNNHKIRTQRNKLLPLGFSPNYNYDFPEWFCLSYFGVRAPQYLTDALRQNILKPREEWYRWVSDEFEVKAWEVDYDIGAPKFALRGVDHILPNASSFHFGSVTSSINLGLHRAGL
jgi:hypothetical protein